MLRYMILHHVGFPIRKSVGRSLFAAHHSLSQLVTSFIGSWCQGIHLTLLFAWTSCIYPILWFSLNCLSFFEHFSFRILLTLVRCEKAIYSPFALCFELRFRAALSRLPPFGEIVCTHFCAPFPFSFGKTNISLLDYLSSSVRFLLKKLFFYSIVKDLLESCDSWSVWMDSNHRPRAYQARALATWATNRN